MESYYQKILDLDPADVDTLLIYAGAMEQKKDYSRAMTLYLRALKLSENANEPVMLRRISERISIISLHIAPGG